MPSDKKTFYLFLGLHSLLIGVFPFYVPVYLWQSGLDLFAISILVAVTGVGFQVGLLAWDRLRHIVSLNRLFMIAAVLLLLLLLSATQVAHTLTSALWLALSYGVYNSFFWTTQRALFVEVMDPNRTGQAYGNFQLFVFAALQLGILAGGWLLQSDGFFWLVCFCAVTALAGAFLLTATKPSYPLAMQKTPALRWQSIVQFKDAHHSRTMFLVDGCFLFLESFFWVISLFLLAHESFTTLGVIVIVLAVIFGGLFFMLKNTIDRLGKRRVFLFAVALYSLSWAIRAIVSDELSLLMLFVLLVIVTFATSFFRLALNKRFYDLARESGAHRYLIMKSYYSQSSLIVSFLLIALVATVVTDPVELLTIVYVAAAFAAPVFALYGSRRYRMD
jgi:MFS family permease